MTATFATAWFRPNTPTLLRIEYVTPASAVATVDSPFPLDVGTEGPLHVELGAERLTPVDARVEEVERSDQTQRVRLSLRNVDTSVGRKLARFARLLAQVDSARDRGTPHREALTSPDEIRGALRLLVELRAEAAVRHPHRATVLRATAIHPDDEGVVWEAEGPRPRPPFLLTADGYNSVYRFPVEHAVDRRGGLVTSPPPWIERVRSRRTKRALAEKGLRVMFDHPLWPHWRIEREVLDLTLEGLSFRALDGEDPIFPGMASASFFVVCRRGRAVRMQGTVRSYRWFAQQGTWGFGCAVLPATPGDVDLWQKLCEAHLFPTTRRGATEVWSVFRASGYFGLSETIEGDFEHLRTAHVHASKALAAAPHLGVQSTWPATGDPRATVANLRLYENSWFSFHLAVQPDQALATRSGQVLRDLYRQYVEHCVSKKGARWQIAYVQKSAHWSMRLHVDLPRKYAPTGHAYVKEFRAFDVRAVGEATTNRSEWRVQTATSPEVREVLPLLLAKLDAPYCDALDYTPDLFELDRLKRDWANHGLERDRKLLVAYDGDEPVALGVVECAEPGLHLFGLLDTLRLHALREDGSHAFDALLDEARAWFRERERRTFCYLEEEEGATHGSDRGIKLLSQAYFTLISVERLPEMLECIHCDTAIP